MAWIESHTTLREHPKRKRLSRLLGINVRETVGLLHILWWWVLDFAPEGDLSGFSDEDVADSIDWEGDAYQLMAALEQAGFVDRDRQIHDWDEFAEKWIERRRANADRMKLARARRNGTRDAGRAPDVQDTCGARAPQKSKSVGLPDQPDQPVNQPTGPDLHPYPPPHAAEGTVVPHDVLDRLSRLPDDLDAASFHTAVESALVALRFSVQREVRVPDRGDGHAGRVDLVAERHGLRIALELDDRTPRQKSIAKLEGTDCHVRVIVLRCPAAGPLPDVGPQVRVIGAGDWDHDAEPETIAALTDADREALAVSV